jgi:hypothetical protein
MKLGLNSDAWKMIYPNLREELYRVRLGGPDNREEIVEFFKSYGVIIKTDTDGRWEEVEIILNEEELTLFLMKWAT